MICLIARSSPQMPVSAPARSLTSSILRLFARSLTMRIDSLITRWTVTISLASSSLPASIFDMSRTSLMIANRCSPLEWMSSI